MANQDASPLNENPAGSAFEMSKVPISHANSLADLCAELDFHESTVRLLQQEGFERRADLQFLATTRDFPGNLTIIKRFRDRCVLENYLNEFTTNPVAANKSELLVGTTIEVVPIIEPNNLVNPKQKSRNWLPVDADDESRDSLNALQQPRHNSPVPPTLCFAILQLLVGIALILEGIIAYALLGPATAYTVTWYGSGFWSGSLLLMSASLAKMGNAKGCPVIASMALSLVASVNGIALFFIFCYALSVTGPESYTIGHAVLYALMLVASAGQVAVCCVAIYCTRQLSSSRRFTQNVMPWSTNSLDH